jgi:DNA-binding XRE family transcriptional regulator
MLEETVVKPYGKAFSENPQTLGEHIRKARIERRLLQKEVASYIGITENCLNYWENNKTAPQLQHMPKIISFLGYLPFDCDTNTLGGKMKAYRLRNGLSYDQLGNLLQADPKQVREWETGKHIPAWKNMERLSEFIPDIATP